MSEPSLEEIYREEYETKGAQRGIDQYAAKQDMAAALDCIERPNSVLDVGCGRGWWMEYWLLHRPQVCVWGVDGVADLIRRTSSCHPVCEGRIMDCDLRARDWCLDQGSSWDLVLCVEVGEHLEAGYAPGLVEGLCALCGEDGTVFFSAARPGQKGVHHINCRPKEYWVDLFKARGFELCPDLRRAWYDQLHIRNCCKNIHCNAMFFTPRRET